MPDLCGYSWVIGLGAALATLVVSVGVAWFGVLIWKVVNAIIGLTPRE